ncbi:hypothetical protein SNEBB_005498 [Seison nebaliae]|nr:hypothetical protein SNEBB_005498 [Seison nebaliae]
MGSCNSAILKRIQRERAEEFFRTGRPDANGFVYFETQPVKKLSNEDIENADNRYSRPIQTERRYTSANVLSAADSSNKSSQKTVTKF